MACRPDAHLTRWLLPALLALGLPATASAQGGAQPLVDRARQSYRAGEHYAALALARVALTRFPADARALELNAQLVRDSQGPVAALPLLARAVTAAPRDAELLAEYAATLGDAGYNRAMLAVARRVVAVDPGHPRGYYLQAVLAARAGRDDLARRLLWRTGDMARRVPSAMLLAGVLELRSGSPAQAVELFDALARRQPDNISVKLLLGRALLANGEANEALARLRPLADRGAASPYLLTLVGRALEQLGRRAEAAAYLDRAARPLPGGAWPMAVPEPVAFATWQWQEGPLRADEAVPALREMLAAGRFDEARSLAAAMAGRYPGSADIGRLVGDVHWLTGQPGAALASYRRSAQVRSDFALVQRIAAVLRALGRDADARRLLTRRLALNPRDRPAAVLLGWMAAERGDWPRAQSLLVYASAVGGDNDPRLLAELAAIRLQRGLPASALAWRAHALQRGNGRVARVLAASLDAEGERPREAAALFAKAAGLAAPPLLAGR